MEPTAAAPLETILVAPPRQRAPAPPGLGTFLVQGFGAARRAPLLVLPLGAGEALAALAQAAPFFLLFALSLRALEAGQDPVRAISLAVRSPQFLFPTLGVALAGALVAGSVRLVLVAGAGGRFAADVRGGGVRPAAGAFSRSLAASFAPLVRLALALGVLSFSLLVAGGGGLLAAVEAYRRALHGGSGGGPAAAALALALCLAIFLPPVLRLLGTLAAARVVALGEGALVALYEAAALLLRRPFLLVGLSAIAAVAGGMAASTIGAPAAAIPPSAGLAGLAARLVLEALGGLVVAFAALTELGALVAVVLAEAPAAQVTEVIVPAPRNPDATVDVAGVEPAS